MDFPTVDPCKVLAERAWSVQRAVLLAMPNWGQDGWGVTEYDFDGHVPRQTLGSVVAAGSGETKG